MSEEEGLYVYLPSYSQSLFEMDDLESMVAGDVYRAFDDGDCGEGSSELVDLSGCVSRLSCVLTPVCSSHPVYQRPVPHLHQKWQSIQ